MLCVNVDEVTHLSTGLSQVIEEPGIVTFGQTHAVNGDAHSFCSCKLLEFGRHLFQVGLELGLTIAVIQTISHEENEVLIAFSGLLN